MYRLGTVTRTAQGLAIVRCDEGADAPDIGLTAVDESLSGVGRVVDVFGPVDRPYLAVSPADRVRLPDLLGTKLYAR
ncbi:H/ACA ribonucleoprotein complex subunit GAR1 [Haloplanus aerogenes]|uniref:H/ACA RNA-protein complex component Gar1 n=1 Tax=Haloplanus aerogenes TaxID=660522 RepID=A0A3M0E9R4_9EURY|nr:Gar1/Naf1 family protein [Haloplanus aerogenes]AZH25285.1 H/ACA RNA-protein complex component Gar1 [Haloplanus aerogenes]RMB24980.1 RNA-binding protein [Haloplanus aerogenes]